MRAWQDATLFLLATIAVTAKIFVGPVLEVRKSLRLKGEAKFEQPISYMLHDVLVMYPMNLVTGLVWKFAFVGLFGVFVALGSLFGFFRESGTSIVPLPLFLAWLLMCMGRVSGLMISRRLPHVAYLPIYALTLLTVFVVWMNVEAMLKECGAQPGVVPNYAALFAGVMGLPPIEMAVGLIVALVVALVGG
jgi:hypothetical protein